MALIAIRGYYRGGQIVLEETPHGVDEVEVVVTFLNAPNGQDEQARLQAVQRMLAIMERGFDLGGKGYPKREELYEERIGRFLQS